MPKLNIIYDARRHEKYHPLMDELERQGIDEFEIWPCIMYDDIVSSINASHKMIVRDAKEKGLEEVFIAEDDLFFPASDGWEYFLKNKPKPTDYDIYLAATYIPTDPPKHICGFHLYCVSNRYYDTFLAAPGNEHIDTAIDNIGGNFVFCYPFPGLQRPGFSANNSMGTGQVVNYNGVFRNRPQDIYGSIE